MLFSFKDLFTTREEGITFLLVGGISALLLDLSILFLVLQGNQKRYYEQKALENEYYLQAELRYFQARQKDQEAVRRLRHDMKNHLFCIQDLLSRGEKQELAAYLEELNTRLSKNAGDISLGNEIADAICWEKARLAEEKGIRITADGKISSKAKILPTDICTIFANALDNALEYLENSGLANPWIHIGIQNQRNLLCLVFENPVTDLDFPISARLQKDTRGLFGQKFPLNKTTKSFAWRFFYKSEISVRNKISAIHNKKIQEAKFFLYSYLKRMKGVCL